MDTALYMLCVKWYLFFERRRRALEEDAVREHIEWMEANNASLRRTAEHFGITQVALTRELMLAGYEGEVKPNEEATVEVSFMPQRNNWV